MEFDTGFAFATSGDVLQEGPPPDPTEDADKILQEAQKQDKPEEDFKVAVDSAFRMEGGGYAFVTDYL